MGMEKIITCVTPPCIFFLWGYACYDGCMPIPCLCLHAAPYFSCHHHLFCLHILHLVPVRFTIVIPTSFILWNCLYIAQEPDPHGERVPFCGLTQNFLGVLIEQCKFMLTTHTYKLSRLIVTATLV